MPVVINEIIIKTNVETTGSELNNSGTRPENNSSVEEIVKQSVAKVLEILEERKER
jgi:hypothetical protein